MFTLGHRRLRTTTRKHHRISGPAAAQAPQPLPSATATTHWPPETPQSPLAPTTPAAHPSVAVPSPNAAYRNNHLEKKISDDLPPAMTTKGQILLYFNDQLEQISALRSIKVLGLTGLALATLVEYIHEFLYSFQPPLEIDRLVLADNGFDEVPPNLSLIARSVKYLDLHLNQFTHIPSLADLAQMEILDLLSNKIATVAPGAFDNMKHLKVLLLKDNRLKYLPPALGRLPNLNLIEVADNPLVMPSLDLIHNLQQQTSDLDWVHELKTYLVANKLVLEQKMEAGAKAPLVAPPAVPAVATFLGLAPGMSTSHLMSNLASHTHGYLQPAPAHPAPSVPTPPAHPVPVRSMSTNDAQAKSSRAARRMGLVLKKAEEAEDEVGPRSALALETTFHIDTPLPVASPASLPISPPVRNTRPRSRLRSNTLKEIDTMLDKNDLVDAEHRLGAYFRRLLILEEDDERQPAPLHRQLSHPQLLAMSSPPKKRVPAPTMVRLSRKVLFAFSEVHSAVRRFSGFCGDKKVTVKMVSHLHTTKAAIDSLVENLEQLEEQFSYEVMATLLHNCIGLFKAIMQLLGEQMLVFAANTDVCFVRMLYLTLYGSLTELLNAHRMLKPAEVATLSLYDTDDVDERLYRAIDVATAEAMVVFGALTKAINLGAIASTATGTGILLAFAAKVKELTAICMQLMDVTKRLKSRMATIRTSPALKRAFWDDTNLFLKLIVQTFMHVKGIMQDLPILNEVRSLMSNLTKTTKDVTILLEVSSYKGIETTHPPLQLIPSVSTIFSAAPRTPLVATLGASALAIKPNLESPMLSPGLAVNLAPHHLGQYYAKNGQNPFDGLIMAQQAQAQAQQAADQPH